MKARHHHYLSQCYLKRFTDGGSKKSKITVIDFREKKHFETIPRNIGGLRDFNRIDVQGVDQNALEMSLGEFEGSAATALRRVDEGANLEGEVRDPILNLIALLAIRSPERREQWRQAQAQIAERIMDLTLAKKDRWASQVRQMKESGKEINKSVEYEEVKKFHESKAYTIEVPREHHIRMEFILVKDILRLLYGREWLLIRAADGAGPLITSDNPVILTSKMPEDLPPSYRNSPGYGMKDTQVYFPLSKTAALIGEFGGREGVIEGTIELVAALNATMLSYTYRQIYAPNLNFSFRGREGELHDGKHLLKHIAA